MVSTFVLLLITLVIVGVLKIISVLYHVLAYWKNKGLPYVPISFIMGWKMLMGYITFADFFQYIYYYFPNAKYVGQVNFVMPAVLLRDPELIKDIMVKNFEHFPDHQKYMDESIEPQFTNNLFSLRGNRWKEMRNILSPTFTASKMKFMFNLISKCSQEFVDYLVDHTELCNEIETRDAFRRYTNDVIATAVFGINVNSMKDRDNEFYIRGLEIIAASFFGLLAVIKSLFLYAFPRFAKSIGVSFLPSRAFKFFEKIVRETISEREKQNIVRPDMIHLLMEARNKDSAKMTIDDMVSQAFIFFLAGFHTTSMLICFAAHELAVNQDVQDRLREEIKQHLVKGNGEISYESLSKMSYMDMVVSETLRKHPPVVFINRVCVKRFELPPSQPGYKNTIIEPDDLLLFPVYSLHRDPKYFPNPDKFDPKRFSEENKTNIVPYSYLPFGHGPRMCLGNRFALMETKILIAHLLQKFTLKAVEKTVEPIVYSTKEAMQPVGGFWIGLEKRET